MFLFALEPWWYHPYHTRANDQSLVYEFAEKPVERHYSSALGSNYGDERVPGERQRPNRDSPRQPWVRSWRRFGCLSLRSCIISNLSVYLSNRNWLQLRMFDLERNDELSGSVPAQLCSLFVDQIDFKVDCTKIECCGTNFIP